MIAVDSSVIIAGCAAWHEQHAVARELLQRRPRLLGHCALEAYSVLTRLPAPHRTSASVAAGALSDLFPEGPLLLSGPATRALVNNLARLGISGGSVYDGLVALTAQEHRATLVTLDRRAQRTYALCDTDHRLLT